MTATAAVRGELEARVGVERVAGLLATRHALVKRVAPLRALYGPGGLFEAKRKAELAKRASVLRGRAIEEGQKPTEAWIDEQAHAHSEYQDWLAACLIDRAQYHVLEDRIAAIDDLLMRENALIRYASAEARL